MNSGARRGGSNRRGGRGRARGGPPAPAPSQARLPGRKSGNNLMDDDFDDPGPDDVADEWDDGDDWPVESSEKKRVEPPRPEKRKVEMRVLRMSEKAEQKILSTLDELYGGQYQLKAPEDYAHLGPRLDRRFWVRDATMRVTGLELNRKSDGPNPDISPYAVQKLEDCGFHRSRAWPALEATSGDVGAALENLLQECFHKYSPAPVELGAEERRMNLEQKEDEKLALQSIYHEAFNEKIPGKLWTVELEIPFVAQLLAPDPVTSSAKTKPGAKGSEACPFYLRGHCKFGRRCHKRHDPTGRESKVDDRHLQKDMGRNVSRVEIRFHDQCHYPHHAPMICFTNDLSDFPKHVSLNITLKLAEEAENLAQDKIPSIFSLVNMLESEDFMRQVMAMPSHPFSFNPDMLQDGLAELPTSGVPLPRAGEEVLSGASLMSNLSLKSKRSQGPTDWTKICLDNDKIKDHCSKMKRDDQTLSIRRSLPAWKEQEHILTTLKDHQVVVISGMTGCGKSTQVPQFILDAWMKGNGEADHCHIICTQPRRISAIGVAERIAFERNEKIGNVVGYQIRLESKTSWRTRLLFCTTGILLRRLESDPDLDEVTHVVVDEVHERSEESDFLLMILRGILKRRKRLKVLLMSATVNAELFSAYFGTVPVIDIPGRTFPVEQIFLEQTLQLSRYVMEEASQYAKPIDNRAAGCGLLRKGQFKGSNMKDIELDDFEIENVVGNDTSFKPPKDNQRDEQLNSKQLLSRYAYCDMGVCRTLALMDFNKINYDLIESTLLYIVNGDNKYPKTGSILVFLPGMQEIMSLCDLIAQHPILGTKAKKFKVIPLHSSLSGDEQAEVFKRPPGGVRKIVVSTNLAETSITIDDCVFVVEVGKMKEKGFDSTKNMESLETVWVSRANALQRKGRAGRVMPGYCFHLYTQFRFDHHFRQDPVPEIQRVPLEQMVLRIKILPLFKGYRLAKVLNAMIEPPAKDGIDGAVERLQGVGALDKECELTPLGFHLAALPVDVRIGKLMLFGSIFRCLDATLTIAACMSSRSPFMSPYGKREEAMQKKLKFAVVNSDHLTALKAYQEWHLITQSSQFAGYNFAQENFLSHKTFQTMATMKHQYLELLSNCGFAPEGLSLRQLNRMARNGTDSVHQATGADFNANGMNWKLLVSVICAALFPNIVQVLSPDLKYKQTAVGAMPKDHLVDDLKFKTKKDGYVNIHPSSINRNCASYKSPYLVFHEKVKTSRIFIRELSMIPVFPMILFGGVGVEVQRQHDRFLLSLEDGWMKFATSTHKVAELLKEMRLELDRVMAEKIANPTLDLLNYPRGKLIIDTIVFVITHE